MYIIEGITKDLKAIPKNLKAKADGMDTKKLVLLNVPYIFAGYLCDKVACLWRVSEGTNASDTAERVSLKAKLEVMKAKVAGGDTEKPMPQKGKGKEETL